MNMTNLILDFHIILTGDAKMRRIVPYARFGWVSQIQEEPLMYH